MPLQPTQMLQNWLEKAEASKATELFLLPGEPPTLRISGKTVRSEGDALTAEELDGLAEAVVGKERANRLGTENAVAHATFRFGEKQAGLTFCRAGGRVTICARPMSPFIFDVKQLCVPQAMIDATSAPHGLLVATGPVGSGKTTTCYSLLEHINATREAHIVLVEYDSAFFIEPKRSLVQQRQVGADAPDMLGAIYSALLQGADVLFVGEIREPEILQVCLNAAETGYLVLTQLHQPTPEAAIRLMIDRQPEDGRKRFREMLSRHLLGVLAQQLLSRADGHGRVAAYGLLLSDEAMRQSIAAGRDVLDRSAPLPSGCQNLREDIARLLAEGTVTAAAAERALGSLPG